MYPKLNADKPQRRRGAENVQGKFTYLKNKVSRSIAHDYLHQLASLDHQDDLIKLQSRLNQTLHLPTKQIIDIFDARPNMKQRLSSRFTVLLKIFVIAVGIVFIIGMTLFLIYTPFQTGHIFFLLVCLLMLLPFRTFVRLKTISFDHDYIYVSGWKEEKVYELKKLKAINEGNFRTIDPFFELELRNERGEIDKVDFMPKMMEDFEFRFQETTPANSPNSTG